VSTLEIIMQSQYLLHLYDNGTIKEEFEDIKGVIRIRNSKDRQCNDQKKNYKRKNNDLQKHIELSNLFKVQQTRRLTDTVSMP
jgi:hypothetical protein